MSKGWKQQLEKLDTLIDHFSTDIVMGDVVCRHDHKTLRQLKTERAEMVASIGSDSGNGKRRQLKRLPKWVTG